MSPRAASTSSASATSSTSTSRSTPSRTCTASAAPAAPGRSGDAISFVTPRERRLLTAIEKATRQPLTEMHLPSVDDVNATRLARFDDAHHGGARADRRGSTRFRDIVAPLRRAPRRARGRRRRRARRRRAGRDPAAASTRRRRASRRATSRERDRDGAPADRDRGDARTATTVRTARARERRPRAPAAAAHGDVPHRGRQAPQGGAAPDRRRARQRGRPAAATTSAHIEIRPDFSLVELPADLPRDDARRGWRAPASAAS